MTAHELLTILSRLPHDAIITIDTGGGDLKNPDGVHVEMSTDLFETRDHVILYCETEE